ncbi:MAG: zf-HC2 domain-containing protein, partial [Myxococcales bacterium]|nr:zf-HC2 domain-containing protein [Myxococcales bacterium]
MPDCGQLPRTSAYIDGALRAAEEADALAHLTTCAGCQAWLRDVVTVESVLSQAPRRVP